uniref:Ovule protein n=1 Tax=Caenorhabditis tropicalis TaxID=1561998 RepID=A0A1I7TCQ1_9PELO
MKTDCTMEYFSSRICSIHLKRNGNHFFSQGSKKMYIPRKDLFQETSILSKKRSSFRLNEKMNQADR